MRKKDVIKSHIRLFLRFLALLLPYRNKWLMILLLSGLGALLSLVNPYLTKLVIDKAIVNKDLNLFIMLALIGIAVFCLNGLISGLRNFLDRHIKIKASLDLNIKVFRKLQSLSFGYFTDKSTGEHLYGISYDIERIIDFIAATPPQAIALFFRLLLVLGIVFYLNWRMAVLSLILTPFLYFPIYYFSRRMKKVWEILIEDYQRIFKALTEVFSHIQLIKILGKETQSIRHYFRLLIGNARIRIENTTLEVFSGFTSQSLSRVLVGLIAFYGG
ncbi:MAG: ABC transporter ATP-binding protein, partial [Candidatus Omnitrophota bacterium]